MANKQLIIDAEYDIRQKVKGLIACTAQEISAEMDDVLRKYNISQTQLSILHNLASSEKPFLNVNEIKQMMLNDNPNVSRSLNHLVDKGLISKVRDRDDQRIVKIMINKAGIDLHNQIDSEYLSKETPFNLTDEEVNHLYELLKKL